MIEFSVIIFSKPHHQNELSEALTPLVKASRAEKGAVMYDLHSCEEGVFVITEKWESQEALDAQLGFKNKIENNTHEMTAHFRAFQEKAGALVEKVLKLPLLQV